MVSTVSRRDVLKQAQGLALATPFLGLAACDGAAGGRGALKLSGATMGTGYSLTIADPPTGLDRRVLKAAVERDLEAVNDQMSNWRARSEVSRFNGGSAPSWVAVSPDTLTVIDEALGVARLSGGAFDPTIGPLVDLWGFGPGSAERRVPPDSHIEAALQWTGFRNIRTRASIPGVAKERPDVKIDLCGVAKGFGVDKVAERLEAEGIEHYLVEIGGELRGRGHSARRRPWRIGVEKPIIGRRAIQRIVALDRGAIATSGNYRNYFESATTRYSHIIDPRTGEPVRHGLASVTVIAPTAMQADALSTALMVLGPEAGLGLAERADLAALFIVKDGGGFAEVASSQFEPYRLG